jgi:diamine N-acetyltransferase
MSSAQATRRRPLQGTSGASDVRLARAGQPLVSPHVDGHPVRIRLAAPADGAPLAAFAARAFAETFGDANRPDDLREHIESAYGVAQQTEEIRDGDVATWLVERDDGVLIGYVQVRRKRVPPCIAGEKTPIEIYRFYVDHSAHGTGVAQAMMAAAFAQARDWGGTCVWLGVWERNARAIAFYRKCGFVDAGTIDFFVGADRQTDRVFAAPLMD